MNKNIFHLFFLYLSSNGSSETSVGYLSPFIGSPHIFFQTPWPFRMFHWFSSRSSSETSVGNFLDVPLVLPPDLFRDLRGNFSGCSIGSSSRSSSETTVAISSGCSIALPLDLQTPLTLRYSTCASD
ncbi:hypothetical protein NPIL_378531 [Nephila pilipes]|uniref:Uncharacterized protein n=1 Tax=Nephila pilipes TaxID=299642 RepID=A0A8X6NJC1_NEPPI|nr:hypothetical protein NPIL_378531 [Nephila pilipes]